MIGFKKNYIQNILTALLILLPALLLIIGFKLLPLARGLFDSFYTFEGGWKRQFEGFGNYIRLLEDPAVKASFINAVKVVATLPIWVVTPLLLAFLIFQRTPGWGFFRAVYFMPFTIAPIIVGQIFRELLMSGGPINTILSNMGLGFLAIPWLSRSSIVIWTVTAVVLWRFIGYGVVTYLAGLATITEDIFDAARIDGASFFQMISKIVLPLIKPIVGYWTIVCTGGMLLWMFPFIFALTEGGPGYSSTLPEFLIYKVSFKYFERGYGTALGIILFLFVTVFAILQIRYMYSTVASK